MRYLVDGAARAAKNDDVDRFNSAALSRFPGESVELQLAGIVFLEGVGCIYPDEFLNGLDISGAPPYLLRLKIGTPVMILRNINPDHDMRNGTKAIVRRISQSCGGTELFAWNRSRSREFITRIPQQSPDTDLPFALARFQFPHRPCFAIAMGKSLGGLFSGSVSIYRRASFRVSSFKSH